MLRIPAKDELVGVSDNAAGALDRVGRVVDVMDLCPLGSRVPSFWIRFKDGNGEWIRHPDLIDLRIPPAGISPEGLAKLTKEMEHVH